MVMKDSQASEEESNQAEDIKWFFYGRRNVTSFMKFNEATGKFCKTTEVEEHYSMTVEPEGRYVEL